MTSALLGLLFLVAMATCQASQQSVVRMSMPRGGIFDTTRGVVKNCGPKGFPFNMTWSPKDLNPEGKLTFFYNVTAPASFTKGMGKLKLFLQDVPDPILELDQPMDCPYLKKNAPMIPCPLKQGDPVIGTIRQTKLDVVAGYKGAYSLNITITNEKDQVVLCGSLDVTIL